MMTPMSEDGGPLREWSPLTNLLKKIPLKLQNGLFTQNINLTCIDVLPEFIAIGTDCGIVYWYNRDTNDMQKLKCEYTNSANNNNNKITCIKIISTVDYMIAIGNNNGVITIFQVPKNIPESLSDIIIQNKKKQIERYNICGLHNCQITTIEWSKNGMKLFTGDVNGIVVLTEIDFFMHLSKSSELLNEKQLIVQLSYQHGLLLVSTTYRTILVDNNKNNKIIQIGQKERKSLGKYGAVFSSPNYNKSIQSPLIYACRPGLRLWQSNGNGIVEKTLMFKDSLKTISNDVILLNPVSEIIKKQRNESSSSFGILLPFNDDLFITYCNDIVYVINPITISVTSAICDLRKVIDVSCTKDEIFILEGERNIIRLSYYPDKNNSCDYTDYNNLVTTSIIDLKNKIKDNSIVTNIPFYKITKDNIIQAISSVPSEPTDGLDPKEIVAEEAIEQDISQIDHTDIIDNINIETDVSNVVDKRKLFEKINQLEFEDVVFNPDKGKKINRKNDVYLGYSKNIQETHSSLMTLSIDDDYFLNKEKRNIENLQKDVESKEKLLADVLSFDLSEYIKHSDDSPDDNNIDSINYVSCIINKIDDHHFNSNNDNYIDEKIIQQSEEEDDDDDESVSYRTELNKLKSLASLKIENNHSIENHIEVNNITPKDLSKEHRFNGWFLISNNLFNLFNI